MLVVTDVRVVWNQIRDKVAQCLTGQSLTVEEVYHQCREGKATLLTGDTAFFIVSVQEDVDTLDKKLLIIVGYGEGDVIGKYNEYIKDLARRSGCTGCWFVSSRKGFARKLPEGYKEKYTLYESEV